MAKNGCFTQYLNSAEGIPSWILLLSVIIGFSQSQQVILALNSKIQAHGFKIWTRNGQKWLFYSVFEFLQGSLLYLNSSKGILAWIFVLSVIIDGFKIRTRKGQKWPGCFTQYLNSVKGIPAWIWVLSIIIESQSNHMDSKSKLKTAKNGCFTQYLNSAGGISLWILVLRKVIWAPNSKIQADGFKIRTQNGQKWCFTQYLNSAKGIAAWILVLSGIIG
ncbi:hypothetical protein B0H13DRAFT_1935505 [Mycena leptocephala]|nr:hypothetical protein B0H13DRAFT_1935505 [Mycena leptocephala]